MKKLYEKIFNAFNKVGFFHKLFTLPVISKLVQYEVISYLFFGVLTTVVNFGSFWLCKKIYPDLDRVLLANPVMDFQWRHLANVIAWLAAVLFAFVTNKLFVFESHEKGAKTVAKEVVSFFGSRILTLVIFEVALFGLLCKWGLNDYLAKIVSSFGTIIFNYIASKLVIFRKKAE